MWRAICSLMLGRHTRLRRSFRAGFAVMPEAGDRACLQCGAPDRLLRSLCFHCGALHAVNNGQFEDAFDQRIPFPPDLRFGDQVRACFMFVHSPAH